MSKDREQRIRERAHAIWEQEGRPDMRHEDHWHQASQDIGASHSEQQGSQDDPSSKLEDGFLPKGDLMATAALLGRN